MRKRTKTKASGTLPGIVQGLALTACVAVSTAGAGPEGGQIVAGQGSIDQSLANTTLINQQSGSMAIDWQSFDVGVDETVRFNQPSSSAAALNRIFDQTPSQIFGAVEANGRIFLLNPSGIVFGQGSRVNVGALFATSMNIDVDDFMNGNYRFTTPEGGAGVIVNRGLLQAATGGSINLFGGAVVNEGVILANMGKVNLAAGDSVTLDFDGDGLVRFEVDGEVLENVAALDSAVSNTGSIQADGGEVLLAANAARDVFSSVVNNDGIIAASRIDTSGGVIRLLGAGGSVENSGELDASAGVAGSDGGTVILESDDMTLVTGDGSISVVAENGGTGGSVQVLGEHVGLFDQASIDASGDLGGGEVLVGGDYKGGNDDVRNASRTYVGEGTSIRADAGSEGDGGRVIVWADEVTRFFGDISATGGETAGDGGFAEVSGKETLAFSGGVDLGSANGEGGTLLLDPLNITISNAADANTTGFTAATDRTEAFNEDAGLNSNFDVTATTGSFAGVGDDTTITLEATNDITIQNAFDIATSTGNSNVSLVLSAGNDVNVGADVTASGTGTITLTADAAFTGLASNGVGQVSGPGIITQAAGTLTLSAGSGIDVTTVTPGIAASINANPNASGAVIINNTGDLSIDGAVTGDTVAVTLDAGSTLTVAAGNTVTATSGVVGFVADEIDVEATAAVRAIVDATTPDTGNIVLRPADTIDIVLGAAASAGVLDLSEAELQAMNADGQIIVGNTIVNDVLTVAGDIDLDAQNQNLSLNARNSLVVNAGADLAADDIELRADDMTIATTATISATDGDLLVTTATSREINLVGDQGIGGTLGLSLDEIGTLSASEDLVFLHIGTTGQLDVDDDITNLGSQSVVFASDEDEVDFEGAVTTTGDVEIRANVLVFQGDGAVDANNITITTNGTRDILVGGSDAGQLSVDNGVRDSLTVAGTLTIGDATHAGDINVADGAFDVSAGNHAVTLSTTGNVTTLADSEIRLANGQALTIGAGGSIGDATNALETNATIINANAIGADAVLNIESDLNAGTAVTDLRLVAANATNGGAITYTSDGNVTTGAAIQADSVDISVNGTLTSSQGITATGTMPADGNIVLQAEDMSITGNVSAAGNTLTLSTFDTDTDTTLGGNVAGDLNLSAAEIGLMTADTIVIGDDAANGTYAGDVTVAATVNFGNSDVSVITTGDIDAGAAGAALNLAAGETLILDAGGSLGAANALTTNATILDADARGQNATLNIVSDLDAGQELTDLQLNADNGTDGGTISFASDGNVTTGAQIIADSIALAVNGTLTSTQGMTANGAAGSGSIALSANDMALSVGALTAAGDDIQLSSFGAGTLISLGADTAGALNLNQAELNLLNGGTITIGRDSRGGGQAQHTGGITVAADTSVSGQVRLISEGGDITSNAAARLTHTGGTLVLDGSGIGNAGAPTMNISSSNFNASAENAGQTGSLTINNSAAVTNLTLVADTAVSLTNNGNVDTGGGFLEGSQVTINATSGSVGSTAAVATRTGVIDADAAAGSITITNNQAVTNLQLNATGDIVFDAEGTIDTGANIVGDSISLATSAGGDIDLAHNLTADAALLADRRITLDADGAINRVGAASVVAPNIVADAGTTLRLDANIPDVTSLELSAGDSVVFTSSGNVTTATVDSGGAALTGAAISGDSIDVRVNGVLTVADIGGVAQEVNTSNAGGITLRANEMFINGNMNAGANNTVALSTFTDTVPIVVGFDAMDFAGVLNLNDAELSRLNAANVTIGHATQSGSIFTETLDVAGDFDLTLISAAQINQFASSVLTTGNQALTMDAGAVSSYTVDTTDLTVTAGAGPLDFINNNTGALTVDLTASADAISLQHMGDIATGSFDAGTNLVVNTGTGSIANTTFDGGSIMVDSGAITGSSFVSTDGVTLNSGGVADTTFDAVNAVALNAGTGNLTNVMVDAGTITVDSGDIGGTSTFVANTIGVTSGSITGTSFTADSVTLDSSGSIGNGGAVTTTATTLLDVMADGTVVTMTNTGDLADFRLAADSATVDFTNLGDLNTGAPITAANLTLRTNAGGDLTLDQDVTADTVTLDVAGSILGAGGQVNSQGVLNLDATGSVLNLVTAATSITAVAGGAQLQLDNTGRLTNLTATSGGAMTIATDSDVVAGTLNATSIDLDAGGAVGALGDGNRLVTTANALDVVAGGGALALDNTGDVSDLRLTADNGAIELQNTGSVATGADISANAIQIAAIGGALTLDHAVVADVGAIVMSGTEVSQRDLVAATGAGGIEVRATQGDLRVTGGGETTTNGGSVLYQAEEDVRVNTIDTTDAVGSNITLVSNTGDIRQPDGGFNTFLLSNSLTLRAQVGSIGARGEAISIHEDVTGALELDYGVSAFISPRQLGQQINARPVIDSGPGLVTEGSREVAAAQRAQNISAIETAAVDPAIFSDVALFDVDGSGLELPADQDEVPPLDSQPLGEPQSGLPPLETESDTTMDASAPTVPVSEEPMADTAAPQAGEEGTTSTDLTVGVEAPTVAPVPLTVAKVTTTEETPEERSAPPRVLQAFDNLRGPDWLLQQPSRNFGVQIIATFDPSRLSRFIKESGLERDIAYYVTKRSGTDWYVLLYGNYKTRGAAKRAIPNLPATVRANKPFARNFGSVHKAIRGE